MLATALLALLNVVALGQTSFDEHFAASKKQELGARESAFLQACGVKRSDVQIVYGLSTESEEYKFHQTSDLLRGRSEAQTDFFGSAEVWKVKGKPRFLNVWLLIMDIGSETNEMFCLDESGKVTQQETLNSSYDVEGGKADWIYVRRFSFDAAGSKTVVRSGYLHKDGTPSAVPKMSREEIDSSRGSSNASLANDVIAELSR
jgi:hypothetical protein